MIQVELRWPMQTLIDGADIKGTVVCLFTSVVCEKNEKQPHDISYLTQKC